VLFIGDDWAEAHHDIEIGIDEGTVVARRRLPEGLAGITMLHELVAEHLDPAAEPDQVLVGIETERGPWVQALLAAGYVVYAINPMQVARYRERHSTSGAKSDQADAHLLAEIVRLDRAHHRPVAGDSEIAEHIKVAARAHQTMIWSRVRQVNTLRSMLREKRWRCWPPHRAPTSGAGCPRPDSSRCSARLAGSATWRPPRPRSAPSWHPSS
jgi:hypothetical protein